jgi:hypothetical protein
VPSGAEPEVIDPVDRIVPVPERRTADGVNVDPTTPAQHTVFAIIRPERISNNTLFMTIRIIRLAIPIPAPLPHILKFSGESYRIKDFLTHLNNIH